MSLDDRLRSWDPTGPDVDTASALRRVRSQARTRRRRRSGAVLAAAALAVVAGIGMPLLADDDETVVDTAGERSAPVRYLPTDVPDGYELAWVDDREEPVAPPADAEPWSPTALAAYRYGYRSGAVEIDVDVFPGYTAESEAKGLGERTDGYQEVVIDIDGAVLWIQVHGIGQDLPAPLPVPVLDAFARSFEVVEEDAWQTAVAPADVAPPFGLVGRGSALFQGADWQLESVPYRPPRATTGSALVLRTGATASDDEPPRFHDHHPALDDDVALELTTVGAGRTVAWGLAPPEATLVRLWFLERTIETGTVPFGANTAFAVEVGVVAGGPRELTAWDAGGERLHGLLNWDRIVDCPDSGDPAVAVPDVAGLELRAAIAAVEAVGLDVRGTGTPPGDPIESATVTAQEPPAGAQVPAGTCMELRTG